MTQELISSDCCLAPDCRDRLTFYNKQECRQLEWYAVLTCSCRERIVQKLLAVQGIRNYLPMLDQKRRWSDRIKVIQVPLFPGYLFVKINAIQDDYWKVSNTRGVSRILGDENGPISVPPEQIAAVARIVQSKTPMAIIRGLRTGQPVKVKTGILQGMEGRFVRVGGQDYLALHINILGRTVLTAVKYCDLELC